MPCTHSDEVKDVSCGAVFCYGCLAMQYVVTRAEAAANARGARFYGVQP